MFHGACQFIAATADPDYIDPLSDCRQSSWPNPTALFRLPVVMMVEAVVQVRRKKGDKS
jgi:hypothetical protein